MRSGTDRPIAKLDRSRAVTTLQGADQQFLPSKNMDPLLRPVPQPVPYDRALQQLQQQPGPAMLRDDQRTRRSRSSVRYPTQATQWRDDQQ
jgi:hypothetical protein